MLEKIFVFFHQKMSVSEGKTNKYTHIPVANSLLLVGLFNLLHGCLS